MYVPKFLPMKSEMADLPCNSTQRLFHHFALFFQCFLCLGLSRETPKIGSHWSCQTLQLHQTNNMVINLKYRLHIEQHTAFCQNMFFFPTTGCHWPLHQGAKKATSCALRFSWELVPKSHDTKKGMWSWKIVTVHKLMFESKCSNEEFNITCWRDLKSSRENRGWYAVVHGQQLGIWILFFFFT